ncbi:MAG: hypothetical protein SFW67_00265 [Myxococcaceae bacterium]|nr:hypothetical protein [Myxococcaceae bacterium]
MRRLVARLVIGAVAVWPLVTLALAFTAGVDPWRLFSFGMYATPSRVGAAWQLQVLVDEGSGFVPLVPRDERLVTELGEFLERRRTLGRLASSREVARAVWRHHPAHRVRVLVHHLELNDQHHLIERTDDDVYGRER